MLDLKDKLGENKLDTVFCIGNSLVHLDTTLQMKEFFNNCKHILKKDGTLIIQIINFDRVISKDVKSLPTIYNDEMGLTFERFYRYDQISNKVFFKTVLSVEQQKIQNEISLTPITHDEITALLNSAGFNKLNVYGDFNKSSFEKENSYMLIVEAK
jgi:hypothetical protein